MSSRAFLALLITTGVLASASANAAGLSPSLNIHSPGLNNTATLAPRGHYPTGSTTPPPLWQSSANDPYDTSTNLNPGGGGGGVKPSKSPALK